MKRIEINTEPITTFHTFQEWVNKASSRLSGFNKQERIICVDKNGDCLTIGMDFMAADEHKLFPVTAHRLIRTSDPKLKKEIENAMLGLSIDSIIAKFANGQEKFQKIAAYRAVIEALARGADPITILDQTVQMYEDKVKEFVDFATGDTRPLVIQKIQDVTCPNCESKITIKP